MEADFGWRRFRRRGRWIENLHNALEDIHDGGFMNVKTGLEFSLQQDEFAGQLPAISESRAHLDEGTHHKHAHSNGPRAIQDIGGHNSAMLSKSARKNGGEFDPREVVAICDHLRFLRRCKLEGEIRREAILIPFDLLVETLGGYAINRRQVRIENHPLPANSDDQVVNVSGRMSLWLVLHN